LEINFANGNFENEMETNENENQYSKNCRTSNYLVINNEIDHLAASVLGSWAFASGP